MVQVMRGRSAGAEEAVEVYEGFWATLQRLASDLTA